LIRIAISSDRQGASRRSRQGRPFEAQAKSGGPARSDVRGARRRHGKESPETGAPVATSAGCRRRWRPNILNERNLRNGNQPFKNLSAWKLVASLDNLKMGAGMAVFRPCLESGGKHTWSSPTA